MQKIDTKPKIFVLCTDKEHPVYGPLEQWCARRRSTLNTKLITSTKELTESGDILFLVSCSELVSVEKRRLFSHSLVLHASDLPLGRGWSPHIWDVLGGRDRLTVSLLEADDPVDTGRIWKKIHVPLGGTELYNEINEALFAAEIELMDWACDNYDSVSPQPQSGNTATYYRKRTREDSEIDICQSLESQFNLLRVCDQKRFPAFFFKNGQRFLIKIERDNE